jgi:hypothetical protein
MFPRTLRIIGCHNPMLSDSASGDKLLGHLKAVKLELLVRYPHIGDIEAGPKLIIIEQGIKLITGMHSTQVINRHL